MTRAGKRDPGETRPSCCCPSPLCPSRVPQPPLPRVPSLAEGCWLTLPARRAQTAPAGTITSILVQPRSSEVLRFGFPPGRVTPPAHQESPSHQVTRIWRPASLNWGFRIRCKARPIRYDHIWEGSKLRECSCSCHAPRCAGSFSAV